MWLKRSVGRRPTFLSLLDPVSHYHFLTFPHCLRSYMTRALLHHPAAPAHKPAQVVYASYSSQPLKSQQPGIEVFVYSTAAQHSQKHPFKPPDN